MNNIISSAIIIYLLLGLLFIPQVCISAAAEGLALCINVVIPSLFPFFVCSKILIKNGFAEFASRPFRIIMRPVFNVPACGAFAFIIGIISGCPVGAKTVVDMYSQGLCTKAEAQRMLCFCNNCGPLFIIGSVAAGMLGFPQIGGLMYASHVMSAILVGIIASNYKRKEVIASDSLKKTKTGSDYLAESMTEAVSLTGYVCGFVTFFAVASAILRQSGFVNIITHYFNEKGIASGIIFGMLEMTNGASFISQEKITPLMLCALSFITGFGGVSKILQVSGITSNYGFSTIIFAFAKFLQGIISAIITYILLFYTNINLPVFKNFSNITTLNYWALSIKIFAIFGICALILSTISIGCKILRRM